MLPIMLVYKKHTKCQNAFPAFGAGANSVLFYAHKILPPAVFSSLSAVCCPGGVLIKFTFGLSFSLFEQHSNIVPRRDISVFPTVVPNLSVIGYM